VSAAFKLCFVLEAVVEGWWEVQYAVQTKRIARISGIGFGERRGDSSTTGCSTIEAQKDAEGCRRKWGKRGFIYP